MFDTRKHLSPPLVAYRPRWLRSRMQIVFLALLAYVGIVGIRIYHTTDDRDIQLNFEVRQHPETLENHQVAEHDHWSEDATHWYSHPRFDALGSMHTHALMGHSSITAILPITSDSLQHLASTLHSLTARDSFVSSIVLVCSLDVQKAISPLIASGSFKTVGQTIRLALWKASEDENAAVFSAANSVTTEWTLYLGTTGLDLLDEQSQDMLLHSLPVDAPSGPCGVFQLGPERQCLSPTEVPQPASFLLPPFVIPTELQPLGNTNTTTIPGYDLWSLLGSRIAGTHPDRLGGSVIGSSHLDTNWCTLLCAQVSQNNRNVSFNQPRYEDQEHVVPSSKESTLLSNGHLTDASVETVSSFLLILSSLSDLIDFSPAACRLSSNSLELHVLLLLENASLEPQTKDPAQLWGEGVLSADACSIEFETLSIASPVQRLEVLDWLSKYESLSSIIILSGEADTVAGVDHTIQLTTMRPKVITIPREDLAFCEWMGTLTAYEWAGWFQPRIEISIVTDIRSGSLRRLLESLSTARYYGDVVDLRINMEQTADELTQQIVQNFNWRHGKLSLNHRIIHGGLLPAVVEAWYPHSNDSYGLILEDDVELSPLFYAWSKMALLRYRYGSQANQTSSLFGISLYQQKNLELRPDGRKAFDPRSFFESHGIEHTHTPYLSQIPCSWGALYFPEHWREFHSYLTLRFSQSPFSITEVIAPNVRSNSWTRSWKKFFIELTYLRGYVMLYPNYPDFVSLSTNHLEIGSHVKDLPPNVYNLKKSLFDLPLMQLSSNQAQPGGLLDLPHQILPDWPAMPVLDLLGMLSSESILMDRGIARRKKLAGCTTEQHSATRRSYRAGDLFACNS